MLKLSDENQLVDLPGLNRFRIGDQVVIEASDKNDRFEGVIVGIELQRLYGSDHLVPSITLLHDGYLTDGFKPVDCHKADPSPSTHTGLDFEDLAHEILGELIDEMRSVADAVEIRDKIVTHVRRALAAPSPQPNERPHDHGYAQDNFHDYDAKGVRLDATSSPQTREKAE